MAEFQVEGIEEVTAMFEKMPRVVSEIIPDMLKAGADVLVEAQREEAKAMGLDKTGGFVKSIKPTTVKEKDGAKYVEVFPQGKAKHGNERKGDKSNVRYATIGFIAEYGRSDIQARPYMTVANEKAADRVVSTQKEVLNKRLEKL